MFCFCSFPFVSPRSGQGSVWESVDEGGDGSGVVGRAGKGHRGEGKQSLREESTSLSHRNCSKSTKDTHSLVPEDDTGENLFVAEELFHHISWENFKPTEKEKNLFFDRSVIFSSF